MNFRDIDLTKEIKFSENPNIPKGFLGINNENYFYLFSGSCQICIDKRICNVDEYLQKLKRREKENETNI